jgi:hypothetical protein
MAEFMPGSGAALRRSLLGLPPAWFAARPTGQLAALPAVAAAALLPRGGQAARGGGLATRELDLADFERLILEVPADVQIAIADRNHARIEAEQRVIDSIDFKSEGRTVRVRAAKCFETRQPFTIRITCRRLTALQARASVDVTLDGLSGDAFALVAADSATVDLKRLNLGSINADIEGSATVTADGKAKSQKVSIGGSGTYEAGELKSESAVVAASGSSDVSIDSRDSLEVSVTGAATVKYAGKPRLKQSVEGAGTLERQ